MTGLVVNSASPRLRVKTTSEPQAARRRDPLACDPVRIVRCQEHHRRSNVVRRAHAAERCGGDREVRHLAAFHAGGWRRPAEYKVMDAATRKIPVAMWVGDQDEDFSLPSVRNTQHVLSEAGFPAELHLLDGRRHSYLDVPADIHDQVWSFLSSHALDGPPRYAEYK